jgi:uncharacterized protein with PIN domain
MAKDPNPATMLTAILAQEHFAAMSLREQEHVSPYKAAKDAEALIRLGKRAARIAVQQCNGIERYDAKAGRVLASWTEAEETRADNSKAKIETEANAILARYGGGNASAGGDPRGYCLKFKLASGRSNGMDSGVWGV